MVQIHSPHPFIPALIGLRYPRADTALFELSVIAGDAIHNLHGALDFAHVSTVEGRWMKHGRQRP